MGQGGVWKAIGFLIHCWGNGLLLLLWARNAERACDRGCSWLLLLPHGANSSRLRLWPLCSLPFRLLAPVSVLAVRNPPLAAAALALSLALPLSLLLLLPLLQLFVLFLLVSLLGLFLVLLHPTPFVLSA